MVWVELPLSDPENAIERAIGCLIFGLGVFMWGLVGENMLGIYTGLILAIFFTPIEYYLPSYYEIKLYYVNLLFLLIGKAIMFLWAVFRK